MANIGTAGLSGLADTAISGLGSWMSYGANKKMADYQFDKDVEMWNMSNQYNSPKEQMARLREAGLNPNLVYGNGNAIIPAQQAPKFTPAKADYKLQAPDVLSKYMQLEMNQAQIPLINAQTTKTLAEAITEQNKPENIQANTEKQRIEKDQIAQKMSFESQLQPYNVQMAEQSVSKIKEEIHNLIADGKIKHQQLADMVQQFNYLAHSNPLKLVGQHYDNILKYSQGITEAAKAANIKIYSDNVSDEFNPSIILQLLNLIK